MILIGREKDLKNVSVAFALDELENLDNYARCFRVLLNTGNDMR